MWVKESTVLNPHYKTMGLYGSEYHSYTLKKRVGEARSRMILENTTPMSSKTAHNIGLVDKVLSDNCNISRMAQEMARNAKELLAIKKKQMGKEKRHASLYLKLSNELDIMYNDFRSDRFRKAREDFVYKTPVLETPVHLIANSRERSQRGSAP